MMRLFIILKFILLLSPIGICGDLIFPSSLIPDTLLKDANAIIRNMECELKISSDNKATYSIKKAVTILNKNGDDHGTFYAFYDNQRNLNGISIKIYDGLGKLIERVKQDDIQDYSVISGFSLYEDNRIVIYEPIVKSYPYTVVTEVVINYKGYIQFPKWMPQQSSDLSVEKASFILKMPKGNQVSWRQRKIDIEPHISTDEKYKIVQWDLEILPAFDRIVFQPPFDELTPNVTVAPNYFTYDGHKGNLNSWNGFGEWIHNLLIERDNLNDETKIKMKSLVSDSKDTVEMIRRIYQYVQGHTRYVSIQYGIGGFQPFDAQVVDEVGYGDCKALTNYTYALLQSVGINSVYSVVKAGRNVESIITDFPSQQFNHVILFVPLSNDTIWLECTNQNMPFGYLGKFTSNRKALAITNTGGSFVNTRSYIDIPGITSSDGTFEIDANGNGHATLNILYSGLNYDDVSSFIHEDKQSQEKWLYDNYYIPSVEIENFDIENNPSLSPSVEISFNLKLEKYAGKSGKRLFIPLNKLDPLKSTIPNNLNRKVDIYIRNTYVESDSIVFQLPQGFSIEHLPKDVNIDNEYGSYSSLVIVSSNTATYIRKLIINDGKYPASGYPELYKFYKSIVKSDKAKIILVASE